MTYRHSLATRRLQRENGTGRKLSDADVHHILENPDGLSQTELAKRFGVSQPAIHQIIKQKTCRVLTNEEDE